MLPAKLEPGELSSAQMTPKQAFGVGWTLAKSAREAKHLLIGSYSFGISAAKYNLCGHILLTPPALRATSPRKRGEEKKWGAPSLELLHPRPDLDFPAPGAAVLLERRPIGLGDGVGIEQAVGVVVRHRPRRTPDAAIDHEMRDMDALGRELARHRLRQPAQRELAHGEGGREREALHPRRGAGQENGAMRFG